MKILVTGGAGFIGSALIRAVIGHTGDNIVNVDKLTYAANLDSLGDAARSNRYVFEEADIADPAAMARIFNRHKPDAVMHLAAESHVDRSIDAPCDFMRTNIMGTYTLLQAARDYWERGGKNPAFRFHHISTDEVFGDLDGRDDAAVEGDAYNPSSPYAASKASADHLVRAWGRTYGLPCIITNCANNYGPCQFPEKLIPHMILSALSGQDLTVYGDGQQVREWLYVEDHAEALISVLKRGRVGETYNIGSDSRHTNITVIEAICALLDELVPSTHQYREFIRFVGDRPGHDRRYALDNSKITRDLGWTPRHDFESGLRKTVAWYLANESWWGRILSGAYRPERLRNAA